MPESRDHKHGLNPDVCDPDQSEQEQPESDQAQPGFGFCGFGSATMLPLTICGMLWMKFSKVRRKRRP